MNPATRFITAPFRRAKALTITHQRNGWLLMPTGLRMLQELEDGSRASTIMAPLLWLTRTFPEAPLTVVEEADDGTTTIVGRHELPALFRKPNDYYTASSLWQALVLDLILTGNAYAIKLHDGAGRVKELWWAPASTMKPKGDETTFISGYEYSPGTTVTTLAPEDVLHLRYGLDPENPRRGRSPLRSVLTEVMTDEEAAKFSASLLNNMGVPGMIVTPEAGSPPPGADDVAATKAYIRDSFRGDKRGEPLVIGGPTKVQQFGFSPEQLALRELRRIPEERISAVLGIPAIVAGLGAGLDRSTFANMSEAREMAYESAVMPLQTLIAEQLTLALLPDFDGDAMHRYVQFDNSNIRVLQEDESRKVERLNTAVQGGWISVAYAQREGFGIEPTEADDVYLRGMSVEAIPVGEDWSPPTDDGPVTPDEGAGGEAPTSQ